MKDKPKPGADFWRRVSSARLPLLALDYDGTLAPFRVQRMEALPAPGAVDALEKILAGQRTGLAVISGRPIDELDNLLGPLAQKITVSGSHGWQWRPAEGELRESEPPAKIKQVLERAAASAKDSFEKIMGLPAAGRIETKNASVAAHTRGLEPERAGKWLAGLESQWKEIAPDGAFEIMPFDGGREIRARGRDKGGALHDLLSGFPETDLLVYLGDDRTDEDAFAVLGEKGVGIKIGPGDTAAAFRLDDRGEVENFLAAWMEARSKEGVK